MNQAAANEPATTADAPPTLDLARLLNLDWQKGLVILLTILAGLALIWVLWQVINPIQHTLILFTLAAALAFAFRGPVNALARHGGARGCASVAVFLLFGTLVLGGVGLLAGRFVAQANAMAGALPTYAADFRSGQPELQAVLDQYGIRTTSQNSRRRPPQLWSSLLANLIGTLTEAGGRAVDVLLSLVISVYLLIDGPKFVERGMATIPLRRRSNAIFVQDNLARVLGGYLQAQLTLAFVVGLAAGLGTAVLGLPYPSLAL